MFARHQEWEQAKQNYESRLQNLTNGDATAQKVEQLEQKLNRAVGLLKNLQSDKQNLTTKVKSLEDEKGETLAQLEALKEVQHQLEQQQQEHQEHQQRQQQNGEVSQTSDHATHEADEKLQRLEQELKAEKEKSASLLQDLKSQLLEAKENNKRLENQLTQQREESVSQMDLSIELNMAKDDLEQAMAEIESLRETNAKLSSKPKTPPMSPIQPQSPALVKELAAAKATIAQLESKLSKESEAAKESAALKAAQKNLQETVDTLRKDLANADSLHLETQKELSERKSAQATLEKKEATMASKFICLKCHFRRL